MKKNNSWGHLGHARGSAFARCQAKTTLKSYGHELRDHQKYSKKIAMKTGTHTQVPVPMTRYTQRRIGRLSGSRNICDNNNTWCYRRKNSKHSYIQVFN